MVRVLIERWLKEGTNEAFGAAMRGMRRDAIHADGYISGETLRDADDARHWVVVSTWTSRAKWESWAVSAARGQARERIAPLLARPEAVTILAPA
jgi:heme-degrading monooxygenase HmoA